MAGGKRASMREGPLSQLFKRTDIDDDAPPEEQQADKPASAPVRGARTPARGRRRARPTSGLD